MMKQTFITAGSLVVMAGVGVAWGACYATLTTEFEACDYVCQNERGAACWYNEWMSEPITLAIQAAHPNARNDVETVYHACILEYKTLDEHGGCDDYAVCGQNVVGTEADGELCGGGPPT